MSTANTPLWYKDYFGLKATEKQQIQTKSSLLSRYMPIGKTYVYKGVPSPLCKKEFPPQNNSRSLSAWRWHIRRIHVTNFPTRLYLPLASHISIFLQFATSTDSRSFLLSFHISKNLCSLLKMLHKLSFKPLLWELLFPWVVSYVHGKYIS